MLSEPSDGVEDCCPWLAREPEGLGIPCGGLPCTAYGLLLFTYRLAAGAFAGGLFRSWICELGFNECDRGVFVDLDCVSGEVLAGLAALYGWDGLVFDDCEGDECSVLRLGRRLYPVARRVSRYSVLVWSAAEELAIMGWEVISSLEDKTRFRFDFPGRCSGDHSSLNNIVFDEDWRREGESSIVYIYDEAVDANITIPLDYWYLNSSSINAVRIVFEHPELSRQGIHRWVLDRLYAIARALSVAWAVRRRVERRDRIVFAESPSVSDDLI